MNLYFLKFIIILLFKNEKPQGLLYKLNWKFDKKKRSKGKLQKVNSALKLSKLSIEFIILKKRHEPNP